MLHCTQRPSELHTPVAQVAPVAACVVPQVLVVQVLTWQVGGAGQSLGALQATQVPIASQTVPPLSVHFVFSGAGVAPHMLVMHTSTMHAEAWGAQSDAVSQATQTPVALQTVPLLSVHVVPAAAFIVPHAPPVQTAVSHSVFEAGQSAALKQAAQVPLPSHTIPPWSVHAVPPAAFDVPHTPPVQVSV
jgi:hypothetical protein